MKKSPSAFRTISEVSEVLGVQSHVLRFWESKFTQIKPVKRAGGRRFYRPDDIALIRGIQCLLYEDGLTIKGAQKVLRERGVKAVGAMGAKLLADKATSGAAATPARETQPVISPPSAQPDHHTDRHTSIDRIRPLYARLLALRESMQVEM